MNITVRKGEIVIIIILLFFKVILCKIPDNLNYEKYINNDIGYEILFPDCWFAKTNATSEKGFHPNFESISFENIEEKVVVAGGGPFTDKGTFFQISTWDIADKSDTLFTIEESIKNGNFSNNSVIQKRLLNKRLDQVHMMNFGDKKLKVQTGEGWADIGINFIYKGKYFRFHFMSGSKDQYVKDFSIYEKMIDSFRLLQ